MYNQEFLKIISEIEELEKIDTFEKREIKANKILNNINKLYIKYNFNEIPIFVYWIHSSILWEFHYLEKQYKLLNYLYEDFFYIENFDITKYKIDNIPSLLLLNIDFSYLLLKLEKDEYFVKVYNNFSKIIKIMKDNKLLNFNIPQKDYLDSFLHLLNIYHSMIYLNKEKNIQNIKKFLITFFDDWFKIMNNNYFSFFDKLMILQFVDKKLLNINEMKKDIHLKEKFNILKNTIENDIRKTIIF